VSISFESFRLSFTKVKGVGPTSSSILTGFPYYSLCLHLPSCSTRTDPRAQSRLKNIICFLGWLCDWRPLSITQHCGASIHWLVILSSDQSYKLQLLQLHMSCYFELSECEYSHHRSSQAWMYLGLAVRLGYSVRRFSPDEPCQADDIVFCR
jgi:hypothetical protein